MSVCLLHIHKIISFSPPSLPFLSRFRLNLNGRSAKLNCVEQWRQPHTKSPQQWGGCFCFLVGIRTREAANFDQKKERKQICRFKSSMASVGIQLPTVGSVWKKKKMSGAILPPPFSSFFQLFVVGMHFDISFLPSSSSNGFCSASIRFLPPPFSLFNSKLLFSFDPSDFCFCDLSLLFASLLSTLVIVRYSTTKDRQTSLLPDLFI